MADFIHSHGIPGDVLLGIFSFLDARDLVACRQVCWQFSQVIASDLSLQYTMTLAFNGLVEPSTSNITLDLPARFEALRKHEAKLQRGNFSCTATQLLDQAAGHVRWQPVTSTSGSIAYIITKANGSHTLCVYLPSSLSAGDVWHNFNVPLGPSGIQPTAPECVAVDPLQDLLVVAETVRASWDVHIRLLSLSTGGRKAHRSATVPVLKYFGPTKAGAVLPQAVVSTRILARYVLVIVRGDDEDLDEILVWDWCAGSHSLTTGTLALNPVVALLDESHLALSQPQSSDIHVYCVGSCSALVHGTGPWEGCIIHSQPLCTLSVSGHPFHDAKWTVENIFSDLPAEHHSDATCESSSFRALPSSAAVVFHITTGHPDHFKKLVVFNSSSLSDVFRDAHRSPPARGTQLPFAGWAGRCLVLDEGRKPRPYLHTTLVKPYGSRLVLLSYPASDTTNGQGTDDPGSPRVHVVDVNKWVAKRSRTVSVTNEGNAESLIQCWKKGTDLDCFIRRLPSKQRLPFAVYKGPIVTFPDGHYPVECIATQSGFSLMLVNLLDNKPAGFQTWTLV